MHFLCLENSFQNTSYTHSIKFVSEILFQNALNSISKSLFQKILRTYIPKIEKVFPREKDYMVYSQFFCENQWIQSGKGK